MSTAKNNPFEGSVGSDRMDSALINAVSGLGTGRDIDTMYDVDSSFGQNRFYREQFDVLIETNWIMQRAVSAYASSSTRAWIDLNIHDDERTGKKKPSPEQLRDKQEKKNSVMKDVSDYQERLDARDYFQEAIFHAMGYGGAALVMRIEDGRHHSEPIDFDNIRTIRGLELFDGYEISPESSKREHDPKRPKYYRCNIPRQAKFELLERSPDATKPVDLIHNSRILRFDGVQITKNAMRRNRPRNWSKSMVEIIFDVFARHEAAQNGASNMIRLWDIFTYKMQGFKNLASSGQLPELMERFRIIQVMMNTFNGIMLDATEEAEFKPRNYSGLEGLLGQLSREVIAATNVPHTIFYMDSPSGLGATGDSEFGVWALLTNHFQEMRLRTQIKQLYKVIFNAKDGPTNGKEPHTWGFDFNPVTPESITAKLNARNLHMNLASTAVQGGFLLPQEVRQSTWGGGKFSFEVNLDDEAWQELQKRQEEQQDLDFNNLFGEEEQPAAEEEDPAQIEAAPEQKQLPPAKTNVAAPTASDNPAKAKVNTQPKSGKPQEKRDAADVILLDLYRGTDNENLFRRLG